MEELKSSNVLDREILEDARKKAERALKNAEKAIQDESIAADARERDGLAKLMQDCDSRIARQKADLENAFPLERRRMRVQFMDRELSGALTRWFSAMSDDCLARLLAVRIKTVCSAFSGETLCITVFSMDKNACERVFREVLPGVAFELKSAGPEAEEEDRGLIVSSANGRLKFTSRVHDVTAMLLDKYRGELSLAFFPEGALS
jgi:V/A-type H+-transporting ATPase subunit E